METMKLTSSAGAGSAGPVVLAPAQIPLRPAAPADRPVRTARFHGLEWTYRDGVHRVVERVPAAVWAAPRDQGWTLVKHNGARDVWRAEIDGACYYLKYFRRRRWTDALTQWFRDSACRAEWNGGIYALAAGIPAVEPVAFTEQVLVGGRRCAVLVTAALEPAYVLSDFWLALCGDENAARRRADRDHLVDVLAQAIARAHQCGFEHLDMHAANILIQPVAPRRYRAVFVDLQSARLGAPIHDAAVVRNLAQLNQWFRRHSSLPDRVRFLRSYVRWRLEFEHESALARPLELSFEDLFRALTASAERHAERLWARRDRRVRRDGRYFARLRIGGGWRALVAVQSKHPQQESPASGMVLGREWWRGQLADPLRLLRGPSALCKDSHSASVARTTLETPAGPLPVIVKRPLARNLQRRLRLMLPPTRSARGWRVGYALLNRELPAARPLACVERRVAGVVVDSLLVTEVLPGSQDLEAHLRRMAERLSPSDFGRHKRALTAALVRHVRRLHERGFEHRDCKAQNILVAAGAGPRLVWIDMDGIRRRRGVGLREQLRALMRLHVSLLGVPGVSRTDRARFLRRYFARYGADPRAWRAAWRVIAEAAQKKMHAKATRAAWKRRRYGRE